MSPQLAKNSNRRNVSAITNVRPLIVAGYSVISVFLMFFVAWSGTLPLSSAAIAKGTVGVEGQKKTIQHLDGGLISRIEASDGDVVHKGDVLIELDGTTLRSEMLEYDNQAIQLEAELARWKAEAQNLAAPQYSSWLIDHPRKGSVSEVMQAQDEILRVRQSVFHESRSNLLHESQLLHQESVATDSKIKRLQSRQALINSELSDHQRLESSGLVTRNQVYELEGELAAVQLELDEAVSSKILLTQRQARVKPRLNVLLNQRRQESTEAATRVAGELSSVHQRLDTARSRLERLVVRSPADGFVLNSQVTTVGGVVGSGQAVMDIMPMNERLLIESRVHPRDRDSVKVGQIAQVRITALDRRSSVPLSGKVRLIAADSTLDPLTQLPYFKTIVELEDRLSGAAEEVPLYPGMEADVIIVTGNQTLLEYLISPIARSFNRAMRED